MTPRAHAAWAQAGPGFSTRAARLPSAGRRRHQVAASATTDVSTENKAKPDWAGSLLTSSTVCCMLITLRWHWAVRSPPPRCCLQQLATPCRTLSLPYYTQAMTCCRVL